MKKQLSAKSMMRGNRRSLCLMRIFCAAQLWSWRLALENTIEHCRLADAAMRHIIAWANGEDADPESGLPHIDHAAASLNMLRGMMRLHPELDDRYKEGNK